MGKINNIEKNTIDSFQGLLDFIQTNHENIFFGAGNVASTVLRCLQYERLTWRVLCTAVTKAWENRRQVCGVPVFTLEYLPHFAKTATFIVAVKGEFQEEVVEELTEFGCKKLLLVGQNLYEQAKEWLRTREFSFLMQFHYDYIEEQIHDIKRDIYQQDEITALHLKTFSDYQEAFHGKEVVLMGTGPTLNKYTPIPDALHIAVNAGVAATVPVDFYFAQDSGGVWNRANVYMFNDFDLLIKNVRDRIFMGRYTKNNVSHDMEYPYYYRTKRENISSYYVNTKQPFCDQEIYQDIRYHPLADLGSVIFPAMHFSLFTHPSRIYIVGCDLQYPYSHFDAKWDDDDDDPLFTPFIRLGWGRFKQFAELYYPDVEIISLNPVGLRGLFIDRDT